MNEVPTAFLDLQTVEPRYLAGALENAEQGQTTGHSGQCLAIPGNYCMIQMEKTAQLVR